VHPRAKDRPAIEEVAYESIGTRMNDLDFCLEVVSPMIIRTDSSQLCFIRMIVCTVSLSSSKSLFQ